MKTHSTIAGNPYVVYSKDGCTVTDSTGTLNKVVPAGDFLTLPAPSDALITSDDNALVRKANFKHAALALRLLGGGSILPAGYKRVEYLEQASRTSFILSEAVLGDELELAFSAEYVNDTNRVLGAEYGTPAVALGIASNGLLFIRVRNESQSFVYTPAAGHSKKHVVRIGDTEITVNGQVVSAADYQMPEFLPAPVSVHSQIVYNTDLSYSRNVISYPGSRVYSFRNWRGGILRGNYIPALDETGAPCMFDAVSRKAFYNAGTGDFIFPSASATYGLRRVLPDWGQLTPHGLRRLYHVPVGYEGDSLEYALENGYKPIFEIECPTEGHWAPEWVENAEQIELVWKRTEPPAEEL